MFTSSRDFCLETSLSEQNGVYVLPFVKIIVLSR